MKLSTIAYIALPIIGVSMLLLLAAPILVEKPVRRYANPDVERIYEQASPKEREAIDHVYSNLLDARLRAWKAFEAQVHADDVKKEAEAIARTHQIEEQAEAAQAPTASHHRG